MKKRKAVSTMAEYIKEFPKATQANMQLVRKSVKEVVPNVEETISYRMPTFKLDGKYLIYMGAFSTHIGIYPASDQMVNAIKNLEKYRVSKGTLHFNLNKPLPITIIKQIVKFRVNERIAEKLTKVAKTKARKQRKNK